MTIKEIALAYQSGADITGLIPAGADIAMWYTIVKNYLYQQSKPKQNRQRQSYGGRRHNSLRTNYAAQIFAQ